MLRVGRAGLRLLQLPVRVCSINRTCPVRSMSGGTGEGSGGFIDWADGCYSSLADSPPVHLFEDFLVGIQQTSGLPWWLSIVMAAVSVKTAVTLPLSAYQKVIISKVGALRPEIMELAKNLRYEVLQRAREEGWTERQSRFIYKKNMQRHMTQLYIRDNCHPLKSSVLVFVQVPLWVSLTLAIRNLSLDNNAGLATGGALWFSDLTAPDPYLILPVCMGLVNLLNLEVSSVQEAKPSRGFRVITYVTRGLTVVMITIAAYVSSGLALYWFSSSVIAFAHRLVLLSPSIHKLLRLQSVCSQTPYRDLLSALTKKYWK